MQTSEIKININNKGRFDKPFVASHGNMILRVQADGAYSYVYLKNGVKFLLSCTLKTLEVYMNQQDFIRIHRKHIVNVDSITRYNHQLRQITLADGNVLPLSRGSYALYKARIRKLIFTSTDQA